MARIPIDIKKIKIKQAASYLITLSDKNSYWKQTIICDRHDLLRFKNVIDDILTDTNTAELLTISEHEAVKVDNAHKTDQLCKECKFKMTRSCVICLLELDSPLERKLFLELTKSNIGFKHQYGLNRQGEQCEIKGKTYNNPENNFKDVLTVVDFYIEKRGIKLCVYTDGHTFHEKSEDQVTHDKKIDRKLQELGYQVLRYTGKEVNSEIDKIVSDIKRWIN